MVVGAAAYLVTANVTGWTVWTISAELSLPATYIRVTDLDEVNATTMYKWLSSICEYTQLPDSGYNKVFHAYRRQCART